ncbi:SymE family type I addiction module toxin [Burkholderia lata]|nr:SymE family type I addiction module toxin [Burkholderia lata]
MTIEIHCVNERGPQVGIHLRAADHNQLNTTELTMADANHNATFRFHDCFVSPKASLQTRRIVPHLRLTDMAPPVLHLWMKLSGRWIEAAGFAPEQRLQIDVTHQRLVITPIEESDGDHVRKDGFPDVDLPTGQQQQKLSMMTEEA